MNIPHNWHGPFFTGLTLEFWTAMMRPEYTAAEVQAIHHLVPLTPGSTILDMPCGNGRHSLVLAREGHNVTAIDIAATYIDALQEAARKEQLPVTAIQADMLHDPLTGAFGLALCLGNSFSYFPYEGLLAVARKVHAALKEGGTYLIHTGALAESVLPGLRQRDWYEAEGIYFLSEVHYHAEESVLQSDYRILRGAEQEEKTAWHHVLTLAAVKRLLADAGFSTISCYRDGTGAAFRAGDGQAWILAVK